MGIDKGKGNFYRKSKYEAKSKNHNFTKWPSEKAADLFTGICPLMNSCRIFRELQTKKISI